MLNLYIGYPPKGMFEDITYNPDVTFKDMDVYEMMNSDFAVRVAKDCSDIASFESPILMKTNSGRYVSPLDLSSGAKNLLLMKNTDTVTNLLWCGDNCDKYVEEVAREKNLYVFTTRVYVPYYNREKQNFKVINTGRVYHSDYEYVMDLDIVDLLQEITTPWIRR